MSPTPDSRSQLTDARLAESVGQKSFDNRVIIVVRIPMVRSAELTVSIAEAVATAKGVDPANFEPPLFESIDTEALERVLKSATGHTEVRFCHDDLYIIIDKDFNITLKPIEASSSG